MIINNVFFHTCDAMHRVVKNNTFLGSCCVVDVTGSFSQKVAQDSPHALDELNLDLCSCIL
jgi:hypothetical protein